MSVIRVGSTSTYADGWEAIFGGRSTKKAVAPKPAASKKAAKKTAKKATATRRTKSAKAGRRRS
jgi:hypothetical protein